MGVFSVAVIFSEIGNGANFALVPHCNAYNNVRCRTPNFDWSFIVTLQGVMSGIVGSFGSLGGLIFALIVRFQTAPGKAFWIIGAMSVAINVILIPIPVPKY
jgi:NNP family nitrate/nitrite transporter-like MFS transporter